MKIKDALLFLVALGVAAAFSKPLPVKVEVKPKKTEPAPKKKTEPERKFGYKLRDPKTIVEHSIYSLWDTAMTMKLDSYKLAEARKIYAIIDDRDAINDLDDDEVNYAIGALNLICGSMSLSSYKATVTDLISRISTSHLWG